MAKLISKNEIAVRPESIHIRPVAGWSWYCSYHDTYGIGDDEDEVLYMAGAHMNYQELTQERCDLYLREHTHKAEQIPLPLEGIA
jgi:hypothetical protein